MDWFSASISSCVTFLNESSPGTTPSERPLSHSGNIVPSEDSFRKLTQEEIETENQSESQVDDEVPYEDNGMTMGM